MQYYAENTYVPAGRLPVPRSASMLFREVAPCSASEVHASNGKPSAFCRAKNGVNGNESWLMQHKRIGDTGTSCIHVGLFVLTRQKISTRFIKLHYITLRYMTCHVISFSWLFHPMRLPVNERQLSSNVRSSIMSLRKHISRRCLLKSNNHTVVTIKYCLLEIKSLTFLTL